MATNLEIKLNPGFREPLSSGAGFVGREPEVARLAAILRHRPAATVLVSGHRGVGKTTLVEEALRRTESPKKVVARLSLPHVNPGAEDSARDLRAQVLRSLARSLHFALKSNGKADEQLTNRAQALYDKTYLKDLQEQGSLEALTQAEVAHLQATRHETRFDPGKVVGGILGTAAGGVVAAAGVGVASAVGADHGPYWAAAAALSIIGCAVAAAFNISRTDTNESTTKSQVLHKDIRTQMGTFDLSPETLEFELKELLTELHKSGLQPVFVIDELDKLEISSSSPDEPLEAHTIFAILSSLKNFFTLGCGTFIFISGEDFYARLESSDREQTYSLAHTLFTDRLFVHVLRWFEVESLIDNLMAENPADTETFRRFRNYLCWESRNHVFDLLTRIGDYIDRYDGETPVLVARESAVIDGRWVEGNLPEDWILAAALQKIVGATFDESVRPGGGEELFNQALWLLLLDTAQTLAREAAVIAPKAGFQLKPSRWTEHLSDQDLDDLSGAMDRLLARCERYGLVTTTSTDIKPSADGDDLEAAEAEPVPATEYAVLSRTPYPDSSVGAHAAPSPFEQGFLKVASAAREAFDHMVEAGLSPTEFQDALEAVEQVADQVEGRRTRQAPPRSRVRAALRQADALLPQLWSSAVDEVIVRWATENGFSVYRSNIDTDEATPASPPTSAGSPATAADVDERPSLGEFDGVADVLESHAISFHVIGTDAAENQILVVEDLDEDVSEAVQSAYTDASPGRKGQDRRKQRLPIVEIRRVPPDKAIELPQEVIVDVEKNPAKGLVAWWQSVFSGADQSPRTRTTKESLAGWTVFPLRPDVANVAELRTSLSESSYLSVGTPEE